VHGGATGFWTAKVLFDRTGTPYLASGWRRFCQKHEIEAGHFVVFNYDSDHTLIVTVFDDNICRRHYVVPPWKGHRRLLQGRRVATRYYFF
jgi:hypothetical protein